MHAPRLHEYIAGLGKAGGLFFLRRAFPRILVMTYETPRSTERLLCEVGLRMAGKQQIRERAEVSTVYS